MSIEGITPSPAADLGDRPLSTADSQAISEGRTTLGIELGSSRIKAVLIGPDHEPLATGAFAWENQLVDRLWTYSLEAAWQGSRPATATWPPTSQLPTVCSSTTVGAIGVSAMMHGYLAFDAEGSCSSLSGPGATPTPAGG